MTPSGLEVDAALLERAAKIAAEQGETVDEVIERMLRAYVETPPRDEA